MSEAMFEGNKRKIVHVGNIKMNNKPSELKRTYPLKRRAQDDPDSDFESEEEEEVFNRKIQKKRRKENEERNV